MNDRISLINFALSSVSTFDGNVQYLSCFMNSVDAAQSALGLLVPPLDDFEKVCSFQIIKSKLIGDAQNILKENNIISWDDLKARLTNSYGDKETSLTLISKILDKTNIKNPLEYFKYIQKNFNKCKSKIQIDHGSIEEKIYLTNFLEKLIIRKFITNISDPYRNNLATRNPKTLSEVRQLLFNDFEYLNSFNRNQPQNTQPQKFTNNKFPTGPIQMNKSIRPNIQKFAPKQQIKNAQLVKPTPMSVQTRQTFNKPNNNSNHNTNYFANQNRQYGAYQPNYVVEELHNTENNETNLDCIDLNYNDEFNENAEFEQTDDDNSFLDPNLSLQEKS